MRLIKSFVLCKGSMLEERSFSELQKKGIVSAILDSSLNTLTWVASQN